MPPRYPRVVRTQKYAYGYHWRPINRRLSHDDGRVPVVGQKLVARIKGKNAVRNPYWCGPGFHASQTLKQAVYYSSYGRVLSFVLMEDAKFFRENKYVARARTILWEVEVPAEFWCKLQKMERSFAAMRLHQFLQKKGFNAEKLRAKARRNRGMLTE